MNEFLWFLAGLFIGGGLATLLVGLTAAARAREEQIERERMIQRFRADKRWVGPT